MARTIKLDLPDWTKERTIRVYAGVEQVAEKYPWEEKWRVKDQRCTRCGECCRNLSPDDPLCPTINGTCIYLEPEPGTKDKYRCRIALYRPRTCGLDPPGHIKRGTCSITYKEQDGK